MKKLACFVLTLVLCLSFAVAALAVENATITEHKTTLFFEYDPDTSTYVDVYSWRVASITYRFRAYSVSDNSTYTGAQTLGTTVTKTSNAQSVTINTMPNFSSRITNSGHTITCSYSDGSYTVFFYGDFFFDEDGERIEMTNTLNHLTTGFFASKTLNK